MSAKKKRKSLVSPKQLSTNTIDDVIEEDFALSEDEEGGTRIGDIYIPAPIPPYCSTESKGPRLIITNIVIENFKSYAGQIDLGPFHQCSSAVIGPNGSGKSNVIDAMLFVFGYRAQKLRSKKVSVLMHNSTRNPNTKSCTVYVYFKQILDKPNDEFEDVPNSEFIISRTAYKDNSTHYSIDNKKVQFKEVAKLLKQHNVDLDHNRFLILQGEVESIAMMKPKGATPNECGLLEYLEDIIGTSRYIEPLKKINEKVEILNEERTEKHNRCRLSEREMNELESPMKEAIDFLKSDNTNTRLKNLLFQKYLDDLNIKHKGLTEEHEKFKEVLADHDKIYEKIKKERIQKEAIIKDEIEKYDKLVKGKDDAEQQLREASTKYAELQASLKATNKRRKDVINQIDKEKHKLIEFKLIPEKNKTDIEKCQKKVERFIIEKAEYEETLAKNLLTLKDETKDLTAEKEKLQTKLIDLQKVVDESKSQLTIAESELKMCKYNETTENRKLFTLTDSLTDLKESYTEKAAELNKKKVIIDQIKPKLVESQQKYKELEAEEQQLSLKLQQFTTEINESVSNMQASKSNNKVLNALMQQKQEGKIPGILGRLGDLGGIDSKYDVAISTCCGRLDNIIVDTVNTAQLCIEYLKKYDVGRASFVALEKVMHLQSKCNTRIQTPENVHRIFDLIRVEDQRVLPAFYFSLYDTLVTDDLEQGTRIAYGAKRYRVVTLKGDLIETSGTMSGGGRTLLRGRMGQSVKTKTTESTSNVSFKSIENLQVKAQEMREKINFLQEQQSTLEKEINIMTTQLRSAENDVRTLTIDLKSITDQIPRMEDHIKKQEKKANECKADPAKVKELEQIIETKKKVYDKSKISTDKINVETDKITKQINTITETKVKVVQKTITSLSKQLEKAMEQISHLTVEITSSERNFKKTEQKIENLNAEIIRAQDTIRSDSELRDKLDKEVDEKTENIKLAEKEIKLAHTNSSTIKNEITNILKEENDGKMKRFEIVLDVQNIEKKMSDVKDQMPHWKNLLKPLVLHEIPNCEPEEPLKVFTEIELAGYKIQDLQYQYSVFEENLNTKKPNLSVIGEYKKKREKYLERVALLEEITTKRNEMRELYDEVRKKRYTEFMQGYNIISKKVKEMYRTITFGGDAELELVDSMDPFIEGISFSVRPPKKSWKMISNLSGGEKTLSSLALVFALHYYKPSPLYVMDEIDAALDFKNVTIVANYIKERAKNAQFIIISLRSNMFEVCDILVGIYKVYDCSSSVAIKNIIPEYEHNDSAKVYDVSDVIIQNEELIREEHREYKRKERAAAKELEESQRNKEVEDTSQITAVNETNQSAGILPLLANRNDQTNEDTSAEDFDTSQNNTIIETTTSVNNANDQDTNQDKIMDIDDNMEITDKNMEVDFEMDVDREKSTDLEPTSMQLTNLTPMETSISVASDNENNDKSADTEGELLADKLPETNSESPFKSDS